MEFDFLIYDIFIIYLRYVPNPVERSVRKAVLLLFYAGRLETEHYFLAIFLCECTEWLSKKGRFVEH